MKIVEKALSNLLYYEIKREAQQLCQRQVWASSRTTWQQSLLKGIQGRTLTTELSKEFSDRVIEELQDHFPPCDKVMVNVCLWETNGGIALHDDTGHVFGGTLYIVEEDWDQDDGGLFVWRDNKDDTTFSAICPRPNMLILNDNNEDHLVTPVSPFAEGIRLTLQIWGDNYFEN